jgi:hypothetical protein
MNPDRSVTEMVTTVIALMEDWINYGFSPSDASRIIAKIYGCNSDKLMDVWLDRKVHEQLRFEIDV